MYVGSATRKGRESPWESSAACLPPRTKGWLQLLRLPTAVWFRPRKVERLYYAGCGGAHQPHGRLRKNAARKPSVTGNRYDDVASPAGRVTVRTLRAAHGRRWVLRH